jgi:hypothetical protein
MGPVCEVFGSLWPDESIKTWGGANVYPGFARDWVKVIEIGPECPFDSVLNHARICVIH